MTLFLIDTAGIELENPSSFVFNEGWRYYRTVAHAAAHAAAHSAACAALEAVDIRASEEKRKNNSDRRRLAGVVRQLSMETLSLEMQKASGEDISIKMERIRGHDYIVAHGANLLTAAKQNEILGQALTQTQLYHMTSLHVCGDADAMQLRYNKEGLLWGCLCGVEEDSASGRLAERAMPELFKRLHGQWYLVANVSQVCGHASCARPAHTSGARGC